MVARFILIVLSSKKKEGKSGLSKEKIQRLEKLGVDWNPRRGPIVARNGFTAKKAMRSGQAKEPNSKLGPISSSIHTRDPQSTLASNKPSILEPLSKQRTAHTVNTRTRPVATDSAASQQEIESDEEFEFEW